MADGGDNCMVYIQHLKEQSEDGTGKFSKWTWHCIMKDIIAGISLHSVRRFC